MCYTDLPQSPINLESIPSPCKYHNITTRFSTRSPESSGESVCPVDRDSVTSYIHGAPSKSKVVSAYKFYGGKTSAKKEYDLDLEIRHKKSRKVQWVKLGKSCLSKFDREEIDDGSRLNDRHINHEQAMIKSQFSRGVTVYSIPKFSTASTK